MTRSPLRPDPAQGASLFEGATGVPETMALTITLRIGDVTTNTRTVDQHEWYPSVT